MGVSEDIGQLVLELAEHNLARYDEHMPNWEQEQIVRYFAGLENLAKTASYPTQFLNILPDFQRQVTEHSKRALDAYEGNAEAWKSGSAIAAVVSLVSGGAATYNWLSEGWGKGVASLLAAGGISIVGSGYAYLKSHNKRIDRQVLEQQERTAAQASPDEWQDALRLYEQPILQMTDDFNYLHGTRNRRKRR